MRRYIHGIYSDVIDQFGPFCHADWSFLWEKLLFLRFSYILNI